MSHKHDKQLQAIFQPHTGNLHWREVESLLGHLGATTENLSGTRLRATLNGVEGILHRPHHGQTLGRAELQHLREFLARARITPSLYQQQQHRRTDPA